MRVLIINGKQNAVARLPPFLVKIFLAMKRRRLVDGSLCILSPPEVL
jgi:hypothetical protein